MKSPLIELRAFSLIDGRVTLVGKATQEKDQGQHFWVCSSLPPHKPRFQPVDLRLQAATWLRTELGAQEVFAGAVES